MTAESRELAGPRGGQAAGPVRSGATPSLADEFSGRPETAPGLGAALLPGTAVALVPDQAPPDGSRDWRTTTGKTQLAVQFAESLWQSGGLDLLLWIDARSRASVLTGYGEAATALGTEPAGDAELVAGRFMDWLATTTSSWLVVLDDLSGEADLDGLWPAGPTGRLLITTTNAATVSRDHRALVLPVGFFSPREALSYLMGRLTADPDQRIGAIDLITELGCEPLALAQATGVIASATLSCRDYQDYFNRRRDQLAKTGSGGPLATSSVTWTFSVEQADRLSPDGSAQSLLALAALLDGHGIPGAVFTTGAVAGYLGGGADGTVDPTRVRNALLVLERTALLAIDDAGRPPMIRMSSVIQSAVRAATPEGMLDRAARAAADALTQVWPQDDQPAWLAAAMRSAAASLQQAAGDLLWAAGCHPLLLRAGRSLDTARLTGPAVSYWTELATVSDRILGSGHPDTLVAGERLASAYLAAGRPADAAAWFQWVVAKRVRALGADHPGTIPARRSLGHALVAANQLDEAIAVLDAAVADYERVRGREHPDTLSARDELAAAHRAAGQFADAIQLGRGTLADRERIQGSRHPDTMTTRHNLAGAYLGDGRLKDAISQYKKTLADRERVLGTYHLDTISARASLGSAYHSAGKIASALQLYEQAGAGYERVLGADHPDTLARRADLAHAYYTAGRLTDAATLLRDTLARCERVLQPGDPLTQAVRDSLANIAGV
jgi:tetratricopeptide (TPR) repeat protein